MPSRIKIYRFLVAVSMVLLFASATFLLGLLNRPESLIVEHPGIAGIADAVDKVDISIIHEKKISTSSECSISLPERAYQISPEVENNYRLSQSLRTYLKDNPNNLTAQVRTSLVSNYVDIDNSISNKPTTIKGRIRVTYINAERGRYWCELANLIKSDEVLNQTDVWIVNEFDLGMARSDNLYTLRLFAYALGLNYAYGIEFLELSHGNSEEKKRVDLLHGTDEWGIHGNAVLSRYPINTAKVLRPDGIDLIHNNGKFTDKGAEVRLGGRMTLFASIEAPDGYLFTVGASHQQSSMENPIYDPYKYDVVSLHRAYIEQLDHPVLFGGDIWPDLCKKLGLMEFITKKTPMVHTDGQGNPVFRGGGGDYICSTMDDFMNASDPHIVPGIGNSKNSMGSVVYMDHQMISVSVQTS